jgi:hypothetical protein
MGAAVVHRAVRGVARYPAEFVLGMAVMGALWLLLGAVLVTIWPLLPPATLERPPIRRIATPVGVSRPTPSQVSALIEVSSTAMSLPTPGETTANNSSPSTLPPVSRAEAAGLVEPQPRSVTHGPPAAQFPVSEVARTASPLVGWPVAGEVSNPFGCTVYYSGIPGPGGAGRPGARPRVPGGAAHRRPAGGAGGGGAVRYGYLCRGRWRRSRVWRLSRLRPGGGGGYRRRVAGPLCPPGPA